VTEVQLKLDPRIVRSRACVLSTTLDIIEADGIAGVSIERVAAESGVAKTTIYRQWTGRGELIFAALETVKDVSIYPTTDSLHHDILTGLVALADGLRSSLWATVMPSIIVVAEHDPAFGALCLEFGNRRRVELERRLRLAVERGEIDADINVELLNSQLVGPLFYRRFVSRQPLPIEFVTEHVTRTLATVTRSTATA
jgi:AcrR family transcriptional regulator